MNVPLEKVPRNYGDYLTFLQKMGVEIYGNRTMMLLYQIDPSRVASVVSPRPSKRMAQLSNRAEGFIVSSGLA